MHGNDREHSNIFFWLRLAVSLAAAYAYREDSVRSVLSLACIMSKKLSTDWLSPSRWDVINASLLSKLCGSKNFTPSLHKRPINICYSAQKAKLHHSGIKSNADLVPVWVRRLYYI